MIAYPLMQKARLLTPLLILALLLAAVGQPLHGLSHLPQPDSHGELLGFVNNQLVSLGDKVDHHHHPDEVESALCDQCVQFSLVVGLIAKGNFWHPAFANPGLQVPSQSDYFCLNCQLYDSRAPPIV